MHSITLSVCFLLLASLPRSLSTGNSDYLKTMAFSAVDMVQASFTLTVGPQCAASVACSRAYEIGVETLKTFRSTTLLQIKQVITEGGVLTPAMLLPLFAASAAAFSFYSARSSFKAYELLREQLAHNDTKFEDQKNRLFQASQGILEELKKVEANAELLSCAKVNEKIGIFGHDIRQAQLALNDTVRNTETKKAHDKEDAYWGAGCTVACGVGAGVTGYFSFGLGTPFFFGACSAACLTKTGFDVAKVRELSYHIQKVQNVNQTLSEMLVEGKVMGQTCDELVKSKKHVHVKKGDYESDKEAQRRNNFLNIIRGQFRDILRRVLGDSETDWVLWLIDAFFNTDRTYESIIAEINA